MTITFPECWGERHTYTLMAFLGITVSYAIRFTLPIGIVAMVAKGTSNQQLKLGRVGVQCTQESKSLPLFHK